MTRLNRWGLALLLTLGAIPALGQQQPTRPVEILYAGFLEGFTTPSGEPARKLLRDAGGQVNMKQENTLIWCDSAYQYEKRAYIQFMGNVRVTMPNEQGGTTTMTCERLDYNSAARILDAFTNVTLVDAENTLNTQRLTHFRTTGLSQYLTGGTIRDPQNTLTSQRGFYYSTGPNNGMAFFKGNVRVNNPQYQLRTDTLDYDTRTRTTRFVAPTWMDGQGQDADRKLYTTGGWYRTEAREALLYPRARLQDSSYTIHGDTLYFDDRQNAGWAHCQVQVVNLDTTLAIFGERAEFDRARSTTRIYDNPFLVQRFEEDTLTLFADTLFSVDDSARGRRLLRAYHGVTFAMREMQGKADSLEYNRLDSTLVMFRDPILWSGASQLTGDTIHIWLKNKQVDSLWVHRNAFLASAENIRDYNQISGREIYGRFRNNELVWMRAAPQAELIYFQKEDSVQTAMTRGTSSSLWMRLSKNEPSYIRMDEDVDATTYPMHEIVLQQNYLKGFRWRGGERPRRYLLPEAPSVPPLIDPRNPPKRPQPAASGAAATQAKPTPNAKPAGTQRGSAGTGATPARSSRAARGSGGTPR